MDLVATRIAQLGGTATRADILEVVTEGTLRAALTRGAVHRHRRGVYGLTSLEGHAAQAASIGATLSHRSAALSHGWPVLHEPARAELIVPPQRHLTAADRRGRDVRYRPLAADDVDGARTSPMRTVIDCARDLPLAESLAVADSAVRAGDVTLLDLAHAVEELPRTGRRQAMRVLSLASGASAGPFESGLRAAAITATGDESWAAQPELRFRDGRLRHPDVGHPALRIALEADSHAHHKTRSDIVRDCHRYVEMGLTGWWVLRFAWEHVMQHERWLHEVIALAYAQRRGRLAS